MFESDLQRKAVELAALAAEVAAGLDASTTGLAADAVFGSLVTAHRHLELAECLAAERVDRSGVWQDGSTSLLRIWQRHQVSRGRGCRPG